MSLDFKGLWNLKDSRVYVLLSGVVLLVCVSLGSIPVGNVTEGATKPTGMDRPRGRSSCPFAGP